MKSIQGLSRLAAIASCLLAVVLLFLPIVWLEIGPEGYKNYGPTVPHVFIYGGWITGKDLSWEPIAASMIFQGTCLVLFALLSFFISRKQIAVPFLLLQSFGLFIFPFWIDFYVAHVINNSDGADLTVHWEIGMVGCHVLVGLNIAALALEAIDFMYFRYKSKTQSK